MHAIDNLSFFTYTCADVGSHGLAAQCAKGNTAVREDPRVAVIPGTRNCALSSTRAAHVVPSDSDDCYLPPHVEAPAHFLDTQTGAGLVYAGCHFMAADALEPADVALSIPLIRAAIYAGAATHWQRDPLPWRASTRSRSSRAHLAC